MVQSVNSSAWMSHFVAERLVRYADLRPCTTAFIDTKTPGSAKKENFTIIGPGVAENPDQHVHINIPHGFNIGAARQPPGCTNSQHSHDTAEVFVVHSGRWAFIMGPNKEDGQVVLEKGDVISIPTQVFRGFENIGNTEGFLYAVLGGDNPGHVTWAPYVFDNAKKYGLVLLDDGSLIDTEKGDEIPAGKTAMQPTTQADVERLSQLKANDMGNCVMRHSELAAQAKSKSPIGVNEVAIIGDENTMEPMGAGRMQWPHGFNFRYLALPPDATSESHKRHEEEVIFVHTGTLTITLAEGVIQMHPGDTLTIPKGMLRRFSNYDEQLVEAYIVRGSDTPKAATITN